MTTNIFPKYIEVSGRQTGKTNRLLSAVKEFERAGFQNVHPIVITPNMSMSRYLHDRYREEFIEPITRHTIRPEVLFKTVDQITHLVRMGLTADSVVIFIDEVSYVNGPYPNWLAARTIYGATTNPVAGGNELFESLIRANGGNRDVYRVNVR